jgi:hypothetical protein
VFNPGQIQSRMDHHETQVTSLGTRHRTKTNKTENREMYILFCPSVFFQNVLKVIVNAQIVKKPTHYTQIFDLV